jgi:hypothetical protein
VNTGRDRDRAVERLLQRSLPGGDSSPAGAHGQCPDAETFAAWVDGGLAKPDVAFMEAHASECARCQALLAAVVQTAPDRSHAASQESWWRGLGPWGLRRLVPLAAAAAAAVILWVAVPKDDTSDLPQQASAELPGTAPLPPQPEADADRFNAPAVALEQPRDANQAKTGNADDKAASVAPSERGQRKDDAASEGQSTAKRVDTLGAQERAAPPAAAAAPQYAPTETATLSRSESSAAQGRGGVSAVPIEIASPDPSVRWRIGGGGSVEHTTNGGATWDAAQTGSVSANLTAGASPSRSVCWLVGRVGTVLLTTDGRTWRRVPFPEMADLASVQAADARTATVTTADGRTFRTTDSGLTWK